MNPIAQLPPQFMNWVPVWNQEKQKWEKFPCLPDGTVTDAHNSANWMTYEAAQATGRDVAFVFTENDPYFFLDLDDCADDEGNWSAAAQAIYMSFTGAIGEVSFSGKGLHIIGKCNPAMLQDRKHKWDGWLEFYTEKRFVALGRSGFHVIGGGTWYPEADWTQRLGQLVPQRTTLGELPEGVDEAYTGPTDDEALIAKMLASTGGAGAAFGGKATVAQLWNADPILCQIYPAYDGNQQSFDHSAADAALMAHLAFWTGKDMPRMERLFRRSALMRPKFERDDYRLKTVQDAARMCNRVYDIAPKAERATGTPAPEVYLTIPEMQQHFEGCVYIASEHKVMMPNGKMLKPEQFNAIYGGHIFQMQPDGTGPEKKAFTAFTENRTHKFPRAIMGLFEPKRTSGELFNDEDGIACVNTYFPAHVEMVQGDVTPFMTHLAKVIPDPRDREIMLAWMASAVQNPHKKFQWAPVLQGTEGNGKTFFANCVAYGIGEKFVHRPNPENLTEKHNGWMTRCLLSVVEEIHMNGRREMLENLKWKITNERIPIRGMAMDEETFKNFTKWIFCTNHMDAVVVTTNSRRYAIFYTAQQSKDDKIRDGMTGSYFPDLYRWAKTGGYAAVAHFLMHYPIPDELDPAKLCVDAPRTSSTHQAIEKSLGVVETEIIEATQDGTVGFRGGFISSVMLDAMIKARGLRVSLNKRGDILESLGYIRCPGLNDGRVPSPMVHENGKRPVIYVRPDVDLGHDPVAAYRTAQGYDPVGMG